MGTLLLIGSVIIGGPLLFQHARLVWDEYSLLRASKMFSYVEYQVRNKVFTTRDNGPINGILYDGLIQQLKDKGGRVLYEQRGSLEMVENVIESRYRDEMAGDWY